MLVRIANREDPDQTASEEAVWSGSVLFVLAHLAGNYCLEFLEHLPYIRLRSEVSYFLPPKYMFLDVPIENKEIIT